MASNPTFWLVAVFVIPAILSVPGLLAYWKSTRSDTADFEHILLVESHLRKRMAEQANEILRMQQELRQQSTRILVLEQGLDWMQAEAAILIAQVEALGGMPDVSTEEVIRRGR